MNHNNDVQVGIVVITLSIAWLVVSLILVANQKKDRTRNKHNH